MNKIKNLTSGNGKMMLFSFDMYDVLVEHCQNNLQYFGRDSSTVAGKLFFDAFHNILQHIEIIRQYVMEIHKFLHEYDCDEMIQGSGYRSIVKVTHEYIKHTVKVSKYVAENRGNLLFRKQTYVKEIESCDCALDSLGRALNEAIKIRGKCAAGSLIPSGNCDATELFNMSDLIDQKPFYGRCIGLHYCESLKKAMKLLGTSFAGYSELYYNDKTNSITRTASSIYNGSKYFRSPELRARRLLELSLYADVYFAKTFLSLTEVDLFHAPPNFFNAKIKVNRLITIEPKSLEIENACEPMKMVEIPIPTSHLGVQSITVRLLSNVRRAGMISNRNKINTHPPSNGLIFHCHGGGFIAQTSKSHEIYLRGWAAQLQVPILSVDYSLSPQAPYPRALEEVFYVYCWAIKNAELLGTTAERIVVVGDSAGAILNMALTLKCIDQNVRLPDGALLNYSPLILGFQPTPSRLLCGMDLALPFGLSMKYLKAYIHPGDDQFSESNEQADRKKKAESSENVTNSTPSTKKRLSFSMDRNPIDDYRFNVPQDPFISPLLASDEMLKRLPPIKLVCGEMDPFLDDNVTMAKRLKSLGKTVGLDILSGLPHGFLNMITISEDANEANKICISHLAELLN